MRICFYFVIIKNVEKKCHSNVTTDKQFRPKDNMNNLF